MNEPIRVLHVLNSMNRGGTETMIMNYYRNINRNNVQFDFLLTCSKKCDYEEEIISLGGKIYRITPLTIISVHKYIKEIATFLSKNDSYNIIHSHTSSKSFIPLLIAKLYNIPVRISHSHNNKSEKNIKGLIRNILKIPLKLVTTDFFACSIEAAEWLYGKKFITKNNYTIIKNAIDIEKFEYNEKLRTQLRESLGLNENFLIGNIARFNHQKNHEFLIDIFKEVYQLNKNARLILVGDGELKRTIQNRVKTYGLEDKCIFMGVRDDIPQILSALDVFILPSKFEGLGLVLIEAQASGLYSFTSADVVSKEAKVTELLEFISLQSNAKTWAEKIVKYSNGYKRMNLKKDIIKSGYDIIETSYWLENFYIKKVVKI